MVDVDGDLIWMPCRCSGAKRKSLTRNLCTKATRNDYSTARMAFYTSSAHPSVASRNIRGHIFRTSNDRKYIVYVRTAGGNYECQRYV